jgi:hypothetical protein
MPMPTKDDYELVNKNHDGAIAELIDVVLREHPQGTRENFGKPVYQAAWKLVEACKALETVYNKRITDVMEYRTEIDRRRQIGLTIDPTKAETMFWWADLCDPYGIADQKFHIGQVGREHFARNAGAKNDEWVHFGDLPEATGRALWERDQHKLVFPYGLHPGDDLINYPPEEKRPEVSAETQLPKPAEP